MIYTTKILLITANLSAAEDQKTRSIPQSLDPNFNVSLLSLNDKNFPPRFNALHPRLHAKIPKMLAWEYFSNFDYYIWMDASYEFSGLNSLSNIISALCNFDFSIIKHWDRSSIYDELVFMKDQMNSGSQYLINRYLNEYMDEQVHSYISTPGFTDNKLYAGGLFCYSKYLTDSKPQFFRDWFYHCARYSVQDQLSLPYLLWLHKISPKEIDKKLISDNLTHARIK